uniref:Uncharacterized protein n=1 Tax=Caenorhabditis japonica TaxID=281687 RepID=A0A8R1HV73_CAEJA
MYSTENDHESSSKIINWPALQLRNVTKVSKSAVEKRRRQKRDGGIVTGPVATALVTGMIGTSRDYDCQK